MAKKGSNKRTNKHTKKRTGTTEIEIAGFAEKERDSQRTVTGNSALSVQDSLSSKYKMNGYWKLLNVLTLISIVAVYYVWQTFEVYRQSYEALSNMPSYAVGLENQPVYLVTTPQIQTESEEDRLLQALLGHPMIYAKIEMSAERTERFDGQNTRRITDTLLVREFDWSDRLFVLHNDQRIALNPAGGDHWARGVSAIEYWGVQDTSKVYEIERFRDFFGEKVQSATQLTVQTFAQQEMTVYGQVISSTKGFQLVSTEDHQVTLSMMPHDTLVYHQGWTVILLGGSIVAFFGSRFHVWRGRLQQQYLKNAARYWIFNSGEGFEFTGLWLIIGWVLAVMVVEVQWHFVMPIHAVQFRSVAFIVLCVLMNRLKGWESFFVADREQDEFIQVDVSRGRTRRVPVAKLTEVQISTQVSKVSPGALEKLFHLVVQAAVLDTPEAKALYPSGFLAVNLSDGHAESVEFEQAFEEWRNAKA